MPSHVELLLDRLLSLQICLRQGLLELVLADDDEAGLTGIEHLAELVHVLARHAAVEVTDEAASHAAHGRRAEQRRREEDADDGAGTDAPPGAVLGRLLPLVDVDGAVGVLDCDGGIVGADDAGGVQVTHDLEVVAGNGGIAVDAQEEEDGLI